MELNPNPNPNPNSNPYDSQTVGLANCHPRELVHMCRPAIIELQVIVVNTY